jgi:hypothetical protein
LGENEAGGNEKPKKNERRELWETFAAIVNPLRKGMGLSPSFFFFLC